MSLRVNRRGMITIPQNRQNEPREKQVTVALPNLSTNKSDITMPAKKTTDEDMRNTFVMFITLEIL